MSYAPLLGIPALLSSIATNRKAANLPGLRMALGTQSRTFVLSSAIFADRALKDEEIVEEIKAFHTTRRGG